MKHVVRLAILLLLVGAGCAASNSTTLYKSVGPDGKVDYSDRPPTDGRVEKTMQFENLPSSAVPDLSHSYVQQLRRMKASQATSPPVHGVVMYAASWCGYCRKARAHLGIKGVAYLEIDIDTAKGKEAFARAGGGTGGVPLLLSEDQRVQGYSVGAYDAFITKLKPPGKPVPR